MAGLDLPKTPGQVAYELWRESRDHFRETEYWYRLKKVDQELWERIAMAGVDQHRKECDHCGKCWSAPDTPL